MNSSQTHILFKAQQSTLFYHLGVRESFGMRQNILLYHDQDKESTLALKVSCANYSFVSYHLASDNTLVISENSIVPDSHWVSLVNQLKRLLKDLEVQSKVGPHHNCIFENGWFSFVVEFLCIHFLCRFISKKNFLPICGNAGNSSLERSSKKRCGI